MRALIQRVTRAHVRIDGSITGAIENGLVVFIGVKEGDGKTDSEYLSQRIAALRIFNDEESKMNLSLQDVGGSVLVVSQFTLHADTRRGNRPSYVAAAKPETAEKLYNHFIDELRSILGADRVASGVFRAMMQVELVNDGPVTLMLPSKSEQPDATSDVE